MTETEVLKKLEVFKNAITELKSKLNEKEEIIKALNISIDSSNLSISQKVEAFFEVENKYNDLKQKTYLTIKHLVENVIEKQEQDIEYYKQVLLDDQTRLEKVFDENIKLKEQVRNITETWDSDIEQLEKNFEEATKENEKKDEEIKKIKDIVKNKDENVALLEKQNEDNKKEINSIKELLSNKDYLYSKLVELKFDFPQNEELNKKLSDAEKEIAALKLKLSVIPKNSEIEKIKNQFEEAKKNAITMEEEFNKVREKAINLEIANRQLENALVTKNNDEMHRIVVKQAERELKEMIDK